MVRRRWRWRWLHWTLVGLAALVLLSVLGTAWQQQQRHANAAPEALAALRSDARVRVADDGDLTLRPATARERLGVVVYPGAYVDIRGYALTLREIAAAGYRVVVVAMPFELAIFGIDRAEDAIRANPDIGRWAIIGHSVGGAMAATFAYRHPDLVDGVIIWDSYPPSITSLAQDPRPVWLIHRATPDGAPPPAFARQRHLFPPSSRWAAVPGGNHMQFGSFSGGGYVEDWPATLTPAQQHEQVVARTLEALRDIEAYSRAGGAS
jgi:pimeloyl-ACP methyl ester carboxylesterase